MNIIMNTTRIVSIKDIEEFLKGINKTYLISKSSRKEKYHFISDTLVKFKYKQAKKKTKGIIKTYLKEITGYSETQIKRIIGKWKKGKLLSSLEKVKSNRHKFPCKYGPTEIGLLAKADKALNHPNGNSLKESLKREYNIFKKKEFKTISQISVSHIYNIRNNSLQYQSSTMHYTETNPVAVSIGERRKPIPDNKPGYLRVDSVHQGDLNGVKGVYHINLVDEVTQWEVVCCVPVISDKYLVPALKKALNNSLLKLSTFIRIMVRNILIIR